MHNQRVLVHQWLHNKYVVKLGPRPDSSINALNELSIMHENR